MTVRHLAMLVSFLLLSACGAGDEVTFRPAEGDSRQYQVHSRAKILAEAGGRQQTIEQRATMIVNYQVESLDPHLRMRVQPTFLDLRVPGGHVSSASPGAYQPQEVSELMAEGFEVELDLEKGQLLAFRGRHEAHWAELMAKGDKALLKPLQEQLGAPGILSGVPATVGAEVTLASVQGSPEVLLKVEAVSAEEVRASLRAHDKAIRVFGYLRLERQTGWLKSLALVSEEPFSERGFSGTQRQQLLMLPVEQRQLMSISDHEWGKTDDEGFIFPAWSLQAGELPAAQASEEQVFPIAFGQLDAFDERLQLSYSHDMEGGPPGHLEFRAPQALDAAGEPVALSFFGGAHGMFPAFESETLRTVGAFLPLGWSETGERLQAMAEIRLQADYFPYRHERFELPVDPAKVTRLEVSGASLELRPLEAPNEFLLVFSSAPQAFFSNAVEGLEGARGWIGTEPLPEDWLTHAEGRLLRTGGGLPQPWIYRIRFDGEPPAMLGAHLLSQADAPQFSRELRFLASHLRYQQLDIPPDAAFYLHPDGAEAAMGAPLDPRNLALEDAELNRLRLTLPSGQAALCQLQVLGEPKEEGHPLSWWLAPGDSASGMQLPAGRQWQLRTRDGVRQYFYGLEVRSKLSCTGHARWQPVELELGEHPWLIDPAALPDVALEALSAADFLQHYRFVDGSGRALALLPPGSNDQWLDISVAPLKAYLTATGLLRVAGIPVAVEQLQSDGEPFEKTWTTQLAPLP